MSILPAFGGGQDRPPGLGAVHDTRFGHNSLRSRNGAFRSAELFTMAALSGWPDKVFADVEANWRTKTFGDPSDSKSTVMASSISAWVCVRKGARQVSPGRRNIAS